SKANRAIDDRAIFARGVEQKHERGGGNQERTPWPVGHFVYLRGRCRKAWLQLAAAVIVEGQVKRESMTPFFLVSLSAGRETTTRPCYTDQFRVVTIHLAPPPSSFSQAAAARRRRGRGTISGSRFRER
ncbi:hypothetical protein DBV15_07710, partial [Temnothorax longispinosus]